MRFLKFSGTIKYKNKKDYLKSLLNMKTGWFSEKDEEDYKKIREEIEEHFNKNSL